MPTADAKARLRCEAPGCEHRTYSSPSNLKRHINSKHNQAIQMSCGKSLPNHQSNIKRHKDACGCTVLDQPLVPAVGNGVGTPTMHTTTNNATMTSTFEDVLDMMLNEFNNAYPPMDNNFFGPFY
ncbi:hypothetical protein BDP55DRAFT_632948 [Colletotrichum godetiae]|uniref:Uncharacterized protein n=1 Tax=Colletotrichum godetiae TaxID=1209918 RepID=A0AAJ0ALA5_9PEZI|nr:uncharacterized protein BDP55DRAFT_632948 [Colletotrichum godetiae]KAK1674503.1 hypothetical protein BDP55DRAFT_632948 [Colletotrichum godetiae]